MLAASLILQGAGALWVVKDCASRWREIASRLPAGDELEARRVAAVSVNFARDTRLPKVALFVTTILVATQILFVLDTYVHVSLLGIATILFVSPVLMLPYALERFHACRMFVRPTPSVGEFFMAQLALVYISGWTVLAWTTGAALVPAVLLLVSVDAAGGFTSGVLAFDAMALGSFAASRVYFALFLRSLRLSPCQDEDLLKRVERIAAQFSIASPQVLTSDLRECYVPFILLSDNKLVLPRTMPAPLTDEEVDSVIAHELAHLANGDLRVAVRVFLALTLVSAAIVGFATPHLLRQDLQLGGLYVLVLGWGLAVLGTLLFNAAWRKREARADSGAAAAAGNPEAYRSALLKLYQLSLAPTGNLVGGTHPGLQQRLQALEGESTSAETEQAQLDSE
jgi:heat shock protein HtpX